MSLAAPLADIAYRVLGHRAVDVAVVINPISGAGGAPAAMRRRAALAEAVLEAAGVSGTVGVTDGVGHAADLARAAVARGATLVVAWGGDGTVNEVASALVGRDVALGLVPAGSANGLARELGVPRRPTDALRVALRGRDRTIDAGELGGRLFVNLSGLGLDADVAARFNARGPGRRGLLPYLTLGLQALVRTRATEYRLRVDGEDLQARALLLAWANAREYGAGMYIAPDARPDDGWLDLVVVGDQPLGRRLWEAPRLFTGTLAAVPGVSVRRCRTLEVEAAGPILFHVDGEPVAGPARLTGRIHPGALRVRVP